MTQKYDGEPVDATDYRSIVGKYMYLVTKIFIERANAARDLTKHFSNAVPTCKHDNHIYVHLPTYLHTYINSLLTTKVLT